MVSPGIACGPVELLLELAHLVRHPLLIPRDPLAAGCIIRAEPVGFRGESPLLLRQPLRALGRRCRLALEPR